MDGVGDALVIAQLRSRRITVFGRLKTECAERDSVKCAVEWGQENDLVWKVK